MSIRPTPSAGSVSDFGRWVPSHNGLLAANFDPLHTDSVAGDQLASASIALQKIWLPSQVVIANLLAAVTATATTYTAGQNFGGLYSSTGTLLAKTADQAVAWTTTGVKAMALTAEAGQSLTQGGTGVYVFSALLFVGTGNPRFARRTVALAAMSNINLGTLAHRFADGPSGQTSLPATIASTAAGGLSIWVGLS